MPVNLLQSRFIIIIPIAANDRQNKEEVTIFSPKISCNPCKRKNGLCTATLELSWDYSSAFHNCPNRYSKGEHRNGVSGKSRISRVTEPFHFYPYINEIFLIVYISSVKHFATIWAPKFKL